MWSTPFAVGETIKMRAGGGTSTISIGFSGMKLSDTFAF